MSTYIETVSSYLPQEDIAKKNRKRITERTLKLLNDNNIKYTIDDNNKNKFIENPVSVIGDNTFNISIINADIEKVCSYLNRNLISIGGHVKRDSYNTLYVYYDTSLLTEDLKSVIGNIKQKIKDKYTGKARNISKVEAKIRYETLSNEDENTIKKDIQKISTEAIKLFNSTNIAKNKSAHTKDYKISINTGISEYYLSDIIGGAGYYIVQSTPIKIKITNKNISKDILKEAEDTIWEYLDDQLNDDYIKKLKPKFKIYAGPETHNCDSSTPEFLLRIEYQGNIKNKKISKKENALLEYTNDSDTLELPNADFQTLLDNTDISHIYLSSDWHLFKGHYKREHNYVNTQKIVTWCRQNIKDTDIFMYLGDISYRWCNEEDKKESMRIMASLPGIKVLIAGNHDIMLGDEYLHGCGFDYIFNEYEWKNLIFTHKPINMSLYPDDYWNIHGHIHKWQGYNTTDGKKNINVYPYFYDNKPVTLEYLLNHKEELVKDNYYNPNDILSETKRSDLPDDAFGIPEDRKYPLDTEDHVKSAIKLFGHAEESKKKGLAQSIRKAAKKYDITIPENTQCYKYLNENSIESIIPGNIKNIVFDLGGVLVNQQLHKYIEEGLPVTEYLAHIIYHAVEDVIFTNLNNKEADLWNIDQIKNYFRENTPNNISIYTDEIFDLLAKSMFKYEYVDTLLNVLRNKGYSLYYLSNWPASLYELEKSFFAPIISKFDGGLFSFESDKYMKPNKEFYIEFFNKFKLVPEECFFFDDKAENIGAADAVGMQGLIFNYEETPRLLLGDVINIPSDVNNTILIDAGRRLESVSLEKIDTWYSSKNLTNIDTSASYSSIIDAIKAINDNTGYVFTSNNDTIIPIGQVVFDDNDETYEWQIQYPLKYSAENGLESGLSEWSMAAYNPIRSTSKPFILKMSKDNNSYLSPTIYAFSPDIISDKYLVVNENAELEIIDSSNFKDYYIEAYEFIGNQSLVGKINKLYYNHKIVDNTIFYTTLTGKPMLCEDQIDFDLNFRKIDFRYLKEQVLSEILSFRDNIYNKHNNLWLSIIEASIINRAIPVLNKYNKYNDFSIKEDLDGYYVYNSLTDKRSSSVETLSLITESMIKSVL